MHPDFGLELTLISEIDLKFARRNPAMNAHALLRLFIPRCHIVCLAYTVTFRFSDIVPMAEWSKALKYLNGSRFKTP